MMIKQLLLLLALGAQVSHAQAPTPPTSALAPSNLKIVYFGSSVPFGQGATGKYATLAATAPYWPSAPAPAWAPALASPQAVSKQTLRNEIDRQRRLEMAFEGERWFDLLRYPATLRPMPRLLTPSRPSTSFSA